MTLKKLKKTAIALATGVFFSTAQADTLSFDRLYTLGDSLTDGGAFSNTLIGGGLPTGLYRFTNNALDGSSRVYAEILANLLGLPLPVRFITIPGPNVPSDGLSGANYAQGGARVELQPGIGYNPPLITTLPIKDQLDQLLIDRPVLSSRDLLVLWAGANDVFVQFGAVSSMAISPTQGLANMVAAGGALATQIDRIAAAGGRNTIVILVPDVAKTPFGFLVTSASAPGGALLTLLTQTFNQSVITASGQRNFFVFDSNKVLSAVIADPVRFGFNANVLGLGSTACGTSGSLSPDLFYNSSLTCFPNSNPNNYLFADGVHPSTRAHSIFGSVLMGSLRAISQASNLVTGPMLLARQHSFELENRLHLAAMSSVDGKASAVGKVYVYGGADANGFKGSAGQIDPAIDMRAQRYRLGIDQQLTSSMLGGILLSYGSAKTEFGAGTGQIKTDDVMATAYIARSLTPNSYLSASLGMGTLDHSFQRSIPLDVAPLTARSNPRGRFEAFRVGVGGIFGAGGVRFGPIVSVGHEKVSVQRFEEGGGPAAMNFGDLTYSTQRASLGLNIDQVAPAGEWRGFGRLVHDWDLKSGDLQVRAGHAAGTSASFDVARPGKTMWQTTLGLMRPASDGSTISFSLGVGGREGGGESRSIGFNYRIQL